MSNRRNPLEYKIPGRVVRKDNIFEGVGIKEMLIIFLSALAGLMFQIILNGLLSFDLISPLITAVIGGAIAFILIKPMLKYNENIITVLRRSRKYKRQQNRFYYVRNRD